MLSFKGRHFPKDLILMAVRWKLAHSLSYRNIEALLEERSADADVHQITTIHDAVRSPALERFKAAKAQHLKNVETYIDIIASIARSQQKQRDAESDSWCKLFRSLRSEMTYELQTEHIRRFHRGCGS